MGTASTGTSSSEYIWAASASAASVEAPVSSDAAMVSSAWDSSIPSAAAAGAAPGPGGADAAELKLLSDGTAFSAAVPPAAAPAAAPPSAALSCTSGADAGLGAPAGISPADAAASIVTDAWFFT